MSELPDSMNRLQQWLSETQIGTEKDHDESERLEHSQTDAEGLQPTATPKYDIGTDTEEGPCFIANFDAIDGLGLSPEPQACQELEESPVEDDTSGLDLSKSFQWCINGYRNLLLAIGGHSEMEGTLAFGRMLEEYGRLKLWGDQNRALLPHIPGSLSYVLRDQPEILETAQSTFKRLGQSLESANVVATEASVFDLDKLNNLDEDSESDLSSESETSEELSEDSRLEEPLYVLLRRVYDQIEFIFQLGSLIRDRRFHDRYLHSSFSHGNPTVSIQDNEYVRVKFDRWRNPEEMEHNITAHQSKGKTPIYLSPRVDLEDSVLPEALSQRMTAEARQNSIDNELIRRLAFANTRRRQQFIYWETYPYSGTGPAGNQNDGENATSEKGQTIQTFSSIAKSAVASSTLDADANATTYAPFIVDDVLRTTARVPSVPSQSANTQTFECPFCHMILNSAAMQNRQTWKRHVFRDLRPYVCTYQDCATPHRMYATRYDWIYHESQLHRRQWRCQKCSDVFDSKAVLRAHLENSHRNNWNATQISILSDMGEEPKNEASEQRCPLCLQHLSLKRITAHVADHLEESSLFSLPNVNFEEGESNADDDQSLEVLSTSEQLPSFQPILEDVHTHSSGTERIIDGRRNLGDKELARNQEIVLPSDNETAFARAASRTPYASVSQAQSGLSKLFSQTDPKTKPQAYPLIREKMSHRAEYVHSPEASEADDEGEGSGNHILRRKATSRSSKPKLTGDRYDRSHRHLSHLKEGPREAPEGILNISKGSQNVLKGILKKPTPQFPEDWDQTRESTATHTDNNSQKDVPAGARWTKIQRRVVSPEALTIGKERFEVREDYIIVQRVLSKEEIQAYATATAQLRETPTPRAKLSEAS